MSMTKKTGQDLQTQVQELQNELSQLKRHDQTIWMLLVQIGNRLQRSSTSIKTAVSSLLDFDIFWDEATQYEFLQDIDHSTDELTDLIVLITLAFRSQAKTLEIETEPNIIQEIFITLHDGFANSNPDFQLVTNYQPEGSPILVDYQYLSVALTLLIEIIISEDKQAVQLTLQAVNNGEMKNWHLQIGDLNLSLATIMRHFFEQSNDISTVVKQIRPENALKLITACQILHLQNIKLCPQNSINNPNTLCLIIPASVNHKSTE
jgi:K+-sensing histidine kinase KdpD